MQLTCQVYNIMINSIFYFYCSPKWKVNFRLSVTFSIRVRHCLQSLLICGALLCANTISAAENNTRKQVYTQALHAATADIAQTAKNKNWQGYSVKMNIFIPAEISRYKPCQKALQVALPTAETQHLSRLRYEISCPDGQGWEVVVTVKPDIYLPIWVAKQTLERGRKVQADDIELKKKNITGVQGGYITDPDEILGLTIKRRIRQLQAVIPSQLEQPVLVTRNQHVLMLAAQDGIEAQMLGIAQKNGRKGELIKVKNLSSGRVVTATVDGSGRVRMLGLSTP
ncbi:flagellar basal body P-ring formation chaperone FlgA [Yersinia pseudotuberculosis]|uniref:flagellar basal body P-ring formation chaperone FlgA n=1 Tax=Yersinia pseudotuberculosis TaxID=633 RepID=UPI001A9DFE13|nr:flagellar basal body P-ring formation chaperone FlgA [Yersinia pseudotuberculosis]